MYVRLSTASPLLIGMPIWHSLVAVTPIFPRIACHSIVVYVCTLYSTLLYSTRTVVFLRTVTVRYACSVCSQDDDERVCALPRTGDGVIPEQSETRWGWMGDGLAIGGDGDWAGDGEGGDVLGAVGDCVLVLFSWRACTLRCFGWMEGGNTSTRSSILRSTLGEWSWGGEGGVRVTPLECGVP